MTKTCLSFFLEKFFVFSTSTKSDALAPAFACPAAIFKVENVFGTLMLISLKDGVHLSLHVFEKTQLSQRRHHLIIRFPALISTVAIETEGCISSCNAIAGLSIAFALIGLGVDNTSIGDFLLAGGMRLSTAPSS